MTRAFNDVDLSLFDLQRRHVTEHFTLVDENGFFAHLNGDPDNLVAFLFAKARLGVRLEELALTVPETPIADALKEALRP